MPWLDGLDEEQRLAASHRQKHALVSAAPGSGKTRTSLAYVWGLIVDAKVKPEDILVLAFSSDAAEEFSQRLDALGVKNGRRVETGTIHAFAKGVLEAAADEQLLVPADLLPEESKVKLLWREALATDEQGIWDVDELQMELLGQTLTRAKAGLMRLSDDVDMEELTRLAEGDSVVAKAVLRFEEIRRERNLRTFDDLIYDLALAIQNDPRIAPWMGNRYSHIVVDEYQDVDDAQQVIIKTAAGSRANVFCVGDEDQCIYDWRGANLFYMLRGFEDAYGAENVTRYTLSKTYRYGHEVAVGANSLVKHNTERPEKFCVSGPNTPRTQVKVRMAASPDGDRYWAKAVLDELADWKKSGRKLSETAVLVRTYNAAAPLELALIRQRIPYRLDGRGVLDMPEVKGMIAYALLNSPEQWDMLPPEGRQEVWQSILNQPFMYVPKPFARKVADSLATQAPRDCPDALRRMSVVEGLRSFQMSSLRKRADLIEELTREELPMKKIAELIWNRLDWKGDVKRRITDPLKQADRIEALNLMARELSRYSSVGELMDAVCERQDYQEMPDFKDGLLITSLHKAKGREWPLVFLPGLTEGAFPHMLPDKPVNIEAERRLAFVGMTRAKEQLVMIAPNDPTLAAAWQIPMEGGSFRPADEARAITSRFLYEIDPEIIRAARTWFYEEGSHPVTDSLIAYAEKAGKPLPGHYSETKRLLTDQPLAQSVPEFGLDDIDFEFA